MKKILIALGALIILIVLGMGGFWYYSHRSQIQTNPQGIGASAAFPSNAAHKDIPPADTASSTAHMLASEPLLRQVTTRSIAGAMLIVRDGVAFARYAERGTGYVYEVNLSSRSEDRVSNTTQRQVTGAVFSREGTRVAFTRLGNTGTEIAVGTIERGDDGVSGFKGTVLPQNSHDAGFSASGDTLFYTIVDDWCAKISHDIHVRSAECAGEPWHRGRILTI